jgi:hypothetical protein
MIAITIATIKITAIVNAIRTIDTGSELTGVKVTS